MAWETRRETWDDLRRIARGVMDVAPRIDARVVGHHRGEQLRRLLPLWLRPTLSLSLIEKPGAKFLPGRFMAGKRLGKVGEYARLDRAGLPVPRWTVIRPETRLDPAEWGPYVVEKPSAGRLGAFVRIRRTSRLRYTPPESLPADHYGRLGPMLAQQFVYTGPWPASYRVVTLLGEVLLCYRQETVGRGAPLARREDVGRVAGTSIVSNTTQMRLELRADADVIALAERAHRAAFPDVPILNFDIIRDAASGALWILECHSHGGWPFSSAQGLGAQAANGVDFAGQFDAMAKAAAVLARATPALAGFRGRAAPRA